MQVAIQVARGGSDRGPQLDFISLALRLRKEDLKYSVHRRSDLTLLTIIDDPNKELKQDQVNEVAENEHCITELRTGDGKSRCFKRGNRFWRQLL